MLYKGTDRIYISKTLHTSINFLEIIYNTCIKRSGHNFQKHYLYTSNHIPFSLNEMKTKRMNERSEWVRNILLGDFCIYQFENLGIGVKFWEGILCIIFYWGILLYYILYINERRIPIQLNDVQYSER